MPFRQRAEPTPADDRGAAQAEVDRARGAMTHWKQIQAEAVEQIASLDGIGGCIANLTGKKQAYLEEAHATLAHAKHQLLKERNALLAAQQLLDRHEQREQQAKRAADEHLLDLEVVAENLRRRSGPLADQLNTLEDELDAIANALMGQQEVISAAGSVRSLIGSLTRAVSTAQRRVLGMFSQGTEASQAVAALPAAIQRLTNACNAQGIQPLLLNVDSYRGSPVWDPKFSLTADGYYELDRVKVELEGERTALESLQDEIAQRRAENLVRQAELFQQRRDLLEQVA